MNDKIAAARGKIDRLDDQIAFLLLSRLKWVRKIGEEKKNLDLPVLDGKREELILARLASFCEDELERVYLSEIYRSIMKVSKSIQREEHSTER